MGTVDFLCFAVPNPIIAERLAEGFRGLKKNGGKMIVARCRLVLFAVFASLLTFASGGVAEERQRKLEDFDAKNFDHSTVIDNEWFPIKPGMKYIWDGYAIDEEGEEEPHSVAFIVTDLVKEIAGVQTRVGWDRDFVDGELEEAEIMFLAQDKDGNVWILGEYPEEYDNGKFDAAPCWIHGVNGHAGIVVKGEPKIGDNYSQGWAPVVDYTDRAIVDQLGQKVTVPAGSFNDVLVIAESNQEVSGADHLKYYAPGVGVVYIGWRGEVTDQEEMKLIEFKELSPEELAKARDAALKLDKHGYEVSKDIYGQTKPIEPVDETATEDQGSQPRTSLGE